MVWISTCTQGKMHTDKSAKLTLAICAYIPGGLVRGVGEGPVPRGNASSYYCDIVNFNNHAAQTFWPR